MLTSASKLETIGDIDALIANIVSLTPSDCPVIIMQTAHAVADALNEQYGKDCSNVRAMLSIEKIGDKVRAHCRRQYDPQKTVDRQLVISEFGEDIQDRYPVKVVTESGKVETEYHSPLSAPKEQLEKHADMMLKRGKTNIRRSEALRAFIAAYR